MGTIYGKVYTLPLPSGNKVRVRRVSLLSMIRTKQLPSALIAAVWNVFGTAAAGGQAEIKEEDRVGTMVELMDACVKIVLVDLKVTDDGESVTKLDDEGYTIGVVNLSDIPDGDKNVLFGFAQSTIDGKEVDKDLEKFRPEPASPAPGLSGEAVRAEAVNDDRPAEQAAGARVRSRHRASV